MTEAWIIGVVALGLAVTLGARALDRRPVQWLSKPLASSAFVALALHRGALATRYGQWILLALTLCWLGDVLLIPRSKKMFKLGLLSFALGHLGYVIALATAGVQLTAAGLATLPLSAIAALVLRWLWPHLKISMRAPVAAYIVVISLMVASACGHVFAGGPTTILIAALAFFLSDLAVARERFVGASLLFRLWGLPLYYLAQVLFALSVPG